jgi:hypothetical protein
MRRLFVHAKRKQNNNREKFEKQAKYRLNALHTLKCVKFSPQALIQ